MPLTTIKSKSSLSYYIYNSFQDNSKIYDIYTYLKNIENTG
jgi:hypothetical protein